MEVLLYDAKWKMPMPTPCGHEDYEYIGFNFRSIVLLVQLGHENILGIRRKLLGLDSCCVSFVVSKYEVQMLLR